MENLLAPEMMTNDEARMSNGISGPLFVIRASDFLRHSDFVIRHSRRGVPNAPCA